MLYKGLKANQSTLSNGPKAPILLESSTGSWISYSAVGVFKTNTKVEVYFSPRKTFYETDPLWKKIAEFTVAGSNFSEIAQGYLMFKVIDTDNDVTVLVDVSVSN